MLLNREGWMDVEAKTWGRKGFKIGLQHGLWGEGGNIKRSLTFGTAAGSESRMLLFLVRRRLVGRAMTSDD